MKKAPKTIKELEKQNIIDFIDDHVYVKENRWLSDRDIWLSVHEDVLRIARIRRAINFLERRIDADQKVLISIQ